MVKSISWIKELLHTTKIQLFYLRIFFDLLVIMDNHSGHFPEFERNEKDVLTVQGKI
uniref:Uncharacterized protein n=1 Tax=Lepeophtheirus salmonis TaxID=72036 RepID=A0A0K2T9B6_LEPSM